MLSRAAFVAHRSTIVRPQFLIASFRGAQDPQNDIHRRQYHVANLKTLESSKLLTECIVNNKNTIGLLSSRNFSKTSELRNAATPLPTPPALPSIPSTPVAPDIVEIVGAEPSFLSLGLGGWSPIGIMQHTLEYLHVTCDLPWWVSIVALTTCIRILVIPLVVIVQRNAAKMHNTMPELSKIQKKVSIARQMGDDLEVAKQNQQQSLYMKKYGINPMKQMLMPLAQAPIFLSMFIGLRRMVNAPVESLSTGGILWFTDLTLSDPYYILPTITSLTLLATIEIGIDTGKLNATNMQAMRYGLRFIPLIVFPFTMNFPAAILCYWTSSNAISLVQAAILKVPAVRDICKIPRLNHNPIDADQKKGFIKSMKDIWNNLKQQRELAGKAKQDEYNFEKAGQGAIVRTYKYDPTKTKVPATSTGK